MSVRASSAEISFSISFPPILCGYSIAADQAGNLSQPDFTGNKKFSGARAGKESRIKCEIRLISSFRLKIRRIVLYPFIRTREEYSCDAAVYDGFDGVHRPVEVLGVACVDDADRAALHLVYLTGDHYAAGADEFAAAYEPGHAVGAEGVSSPSGSMVYSS